MNDANREDRLLCCLFHPKEVVVGVCHLCLNERLTILASSKQYRHHHHRRRLRNKIKNGFISQKNQSLPRSSKQDQEQQHPSTTSTLPKIFALSSLLNRIGHRKSDDNYYDTHASTSQEDSFISIKFENNGVGSWEKGKVSTKVSLEHCNKMSWNHSLSATTTKAGTAKSTVVEHVNPRAASLRWRKRIGHLFQLVRWKRTNKGNVCHVGTKLEGVKVRNGNGNGGWIRTLTKRRTKE